jgi:PAS domain S-box-containing protein
VVRRVAGAPKGGRPMTRPCTILVVEDNPATLRMLRFVLEADGYGVVTAADARSAIEAAAGSLPDLVLQDLILPDMDGFELVRHLRAIPGAAELPILALSGFLGRLEEARSGEAGFTALLVKPILPSQLRHTIRLYLPRQLPLPTAVGDGRRLLVVDDNAVQLRLARMHFAQVGFDVATAGSAADAMRAAVATRPDIILSDVFMTDVDGFQFCLDVRAQPALRDVPVVLMSARNLTDADRDLGRRVGASAVVLHAPGFDDATAALLDALKSGAAASGDAVSDQVRLQHAGHVIKQLERQLEIASSIAKQGAHQAAQLALLSGVSALTLNADIDVALRDVLAATLDAAGISKGALFLKEPDGTLRMRQAIGFSPGEHARLDTFFGGAAALGEMIERGSVFSVPSASVSDDVERAARFAAAADVAETQIVPLVSDGRVVGAIMLAATHSDMTSDNSIAFARAMGNQLVQSLELAKSVDRLAVSEARYRTLLDSASDAIAIVTEDGRIHEVNRRWEDMLGLPREQLVGRYFSDVTTPAPDRNHVEGHQSATAASGTAAFHVHRPDGTIVVMEFSRTTVDIAGEAVVFTVGRDVTEERHLEAQLRQALKLEAVGRLAGGVAHDFNNVLTAILGFCHLLLEDLDEAAPQRADVLEIEKAGQRAAGLTRQLLAFSRHQVLQPKILEVNFLVSGIEPMLRRLIFEHVELSTQLKPDVGSIAIDVTQFEQILVNLVVNAADAMPRGGKLTIATDNARLGERDYVLLSVGDTGTGMDEPTRQRIFEPFFSTKGVGKGTGLGLSTVYGIVKQSGGEIAVDTAPGHGSTFKIYVPRVSAGAAAVESGAVAGEEPRGSETVLVVEDDAGVRRFAGLTLRRNGYQVLEAGSPREAEQAAAGCTNSIHLLLSDVIMPDSEGAPLFDRLKHVRPDLRVLYMSGYTDDTIIGHGIRREEVPFLQKPFTRLALARKVREVLDA